MLEAWYKVLDQEGGQHVMYLDIVDHIFLSFEVVLKCCLLLRFIAILREKLLDSASVRRLHRIEICSSHLYSTHHLFAFLFKLISFLDTLSECYYFEIFLY